MYAENLTTIFLYIVSAIILWTLFSRFKFWKMMNGIGVAISFYIILSYTVLNRIPSSTHEVTFFATYGPEFYREMTMNAFLYFPFGLTLSIFIGPFSILIAFVLSFSIELYQYITGTGLAQGTDVIMNTLGVVLGCIPFYLVKSGIAEKVFSMNTGKKIYYFLKNSRFAPIFKYFYESIILLEYHVCCLIWRSKETDRQAVVNNVTFIYKSFERKGMAKRLYYNIQKYYPGARVIICDDSKVPLDFDGPQIIHLPFNSGLGAGMVALLDAVDTPYVMRMDDDELLTPKSNIAIQLEFLEAHKEIDLSAVQAMPPRLRKPEELAKDYLKFTMAGSGREPLIPLHKRIDDRHIVVAKVPNVFLARTDSLRKVGYDSNIRMIDHHEFFYRAMGVITCVMDEKSFIFHYHNRFDKHYDKYRSAVAGDSAYIRKKHAKK